MPYKGEDKNVLHEFNGLQESHDEFDLQDFDESNYTRHNNSGPPLSDSKQDLVDKDKQVKDGIKTTMAEFLFMVWMVLSFPFCFGCWKKPTFAQHHKEVSFWCSSDQFIHGKRIYSEAFLVPSLASKFLQHLQLFTSTYLLLY